MAREEQLGIRCSEISQRHRMWGVVPMTDVDYLLAVEYDRSEPVSLIQYGAVIDWKYNIGFPNENDANLQALSSLATRAGLPFFVVSYRVSDWRIQVFPMNQLGRSSLKRSFKEMSEREFVQFLHVLRGREAPEEILAQLNDLPEDDWM